MKSRVKRELSAILILSMLCTWIPAPAFAYGAEEENTTTGTVQTITLPVVDEGEEAPEPQGYGGEISTFALIPHDEETYYAYVGADGIQVENVYIYSPDTTDKAPEEPAQNGILQMINSAGQVVASSEAITHYYLKYIDGSYKWYIAHENLKPTGVLQAGTYTLRLTAGNKIYPCSGTVEVVGEGYLILSNATVSSLYPGEAALEVSIRFYGFETEEDLQALSFDLLNPDGDVIAKSTGAYRDLETGYNDGSWGIYAQLLVEKGQAIIEETEYSLRISYSGKKTLVDGVGAVTATPWMPSAKIVALRVLDAQTSRIAVDLQYLTVGENYTLTASENWNSGTLSSVSFTASETTGTVELQLTRGGVTVPMTGYGYSIFFELHGEDSTYPEDDRSLDNPYYNIQEELIYFYPFYMNPNTVSLDFWIEFYNGCSAYKGNGDVLSLRDSGGNEVGYCNSMALEQDGASGKIKGALQMTSALRDNTTYYVYLNGMQFDTIYVTSQLYTSASARYTDYSSAFWMNLGQFQIEVDALNSSGIGKFVFLDDNDAVALSSEEITGSPSEYDGHLNYSYTFTEEQFAALSSGQSYRLVFLDGNQQDILWSNPLTYDGQPTGFDPTNSHHIYIEWNSLYAGAQDISAGVYLSNGNLRNLAETELEALENIRLTNGLTAYTVESYTGSYSEDGREYELTLRLDKPLVEGEYKALYKDTEINSYIAVAAAETGTKPSIYGNDAQNGYVRGRHLPIDSAYTGKIYLGYNCITDKAFSMKLRGENNGDVQFLDFDKGILAGLEIGEYELWVFQDGKILGRVDLIIVADTVPIITVNDEDNDWLDSGDPVMHVPSVYIEVSNMGAYGYLRWAGTEAALAEEAFQPYYSNSYYSYELEGEDGPKTLYVELSKTGQDSDPDNLLYDVDLWLCTDEDYGLRVPDEFQGVKGLDYWDNYTITATTEVSAANVWVTFIDSQGDSQNEQMSYLGPQGDRYEFGLTIQAGDYDDTSFIRVFATDLSKEYYSNEGYQGNIMGEIVERVLIFGDPTTIILPQFRSNYRVFTNQDSFTMYGYATPGGTVTVESGDDVYGTGTADDNGYFSISLKNLGEGEHQLTVSDSYDLTNDTTTVLVVDTAAPVLDSVGFTFLDDGAAVIHWVCTDGDVDHFEVYQNGSYLGEASSSTSSYNVTTSPDGGNSFTIRAVDKAGNIGEKTVSVEDQELPTAPSDLQVMQKTTTFITLSWTAGTDNMGVAGYNVYQGDELVGRTAGTDTVYTVTGLEQGTEYTFTVRTRDRAGNLSDEGVQLTASTVKLTLAAELEQSYIADEYAARQIEIPVTVAADEIGYTVSVSRMTLEYRMSNSENWAGSGMANDGESIFWNISGSEDGYLPVGSYALRITATDSNGGQVSEEYTVMLKRDDEAPTVPGIPTAVSHSTTTITLAWTASTDNVAVDHYEIYRGSVKVGESERTTYTDTGLEMSKAYSYTVKAVDARGNTSNASAEASLSTMELAFDSVISFNSSYTMEEQKNKRIDVWAKFKPETGYTPDVTMAMEYKFITAVDWTSVALDAASGDASLFQGYWSISGSDTGYLPAGSYQVRFAVTDGNATAYSETQTVALSRDEIAPVVESISPEGETMSGRELTISAHATDNVEVERVLLSYAPEGAELFTELGQMTTSGGDHFTYTWDASQLKSGNYTIKVEAYDLRGNMGNKTATITVDNTAPIPPESFFVGGNSEKITVMWSYPALTPGSDFKAFRVYRSAAADGEFMCVKELSTIGYYDTTETGILANMTYYYYVTAVDQYGNESVGTVVRSGQLTNDTHVPVIHSILPVDEAVLQKSAEFSVSATDNYMLGTCEIAYQVAGATAWTPLASLTPEATTRDHIYHFTWDLTGVEAGAYTVRFTVQDGSGLSAETTRNYTVRSYSAPQAPSLTAVPDGHKIIRLSWTYGGDTESLQSFALYRGTDTDGKLSYVCGLSADTRQYLDQVRFDGESQTYRYQVVALDQFGARAESAAVSVTAVSNDSEPPVAVIGPANLTYAAVGTPIDLTGEGSTDNDAVVSYTWNFGDGGSAASMKTQHVYAATGTYTVTLTVADAYGNLDTDTVEITVVDPSGKDTAYTLLNLSTCDAITEAPIENAEITLDGGAETIQVWTDADGAASCVVPNGSYSVGIYADSYLVRTVTLEAAGGTTEHTIGLTNGSIMSGSLTATEMTYDEIVTAGIDPNAPGNQHVYKFAAELTFTVGLESYQLPYTVYKNAQGQILSGGGSGGGFFTLDGVSGGFGGLNIGLFPITENFVLVIYGEARWLKEMYNVELVVMNHSATDTLDQVAAELELPEGLSLADMVDGAQSAIQNLGNVGHNETATARWYVRGDQEGEYNLTAKVHAVSMPYGEVIQQTFTTQEPLKVYAGSALRLTVTANDFTERGEQYPVTLRLENVSDKSIYNLSFGVTGVEQFKVLRMGNQTVELPIDGEDFEDQFIRTVPELAPGGYMEIEISSTIWFNSIAEVGEAALKTYLNTKGLGVLGSFVNVGYYLQDISVVTLEGSTTTIPYTIQVKQTDRPDFLLTAYEAAKDLYEGEEPPSTLMDMMVEVFGNELPIWAQEGAKVVLSLPQGTTDYDVRITLADGTQDGQTLCNEYVSITSGTGLEAFFEDMNTITIRSDENGSFAINGLKAGDTELNISVSDKDGFQVDYKIPLHINDEKVDVKFDLGMDPDTGEFSINSDMIGRIVESLQGEEKATFEENPFLWFASHLELNLEASEEGLEDVLSLDKDTLNDLLAETALSYLDMNGGVASLSLDRETLQQVENAKSDTEAVRIILRELGADAAEDMFGVDRPTYEFMIQVGEDVGKTVSQFGEGQVQVEIPYELQDGESAEDIVIQRVEEDGSYELVPSQYDSAAGLVSFTTDQFSYYRIGLSNQQMPEPEEPDSGGGSIGSSTNQNTETVTNTDGSTTTTVTNSDGSTTATTEAPNGSSSTVNTSKDGKIEANVTLSSKAVQEAKGEPIALPMPSIPGTTNKSNAPTVTVELPSNTSVKIEIPVENVTAGTVAVLVKADGTEEIVKASVPTEAGVVLMVSNGDTVKIVDNTVSFADVSDTYWGADAIVFVYSRALFNGTSATTFGPEADMTRAMLLTVLARYAGVDTSASDTWYGAGVQWAMDMGISDGTNLDSSITREQLATMLYRYAGEPEITATITGFPDTASVSDWASDAMTWAVQSGLIAGMGNNTLAPQGTATRAQVATILMRFIQSYITK